MVEYDDDGLEIPPPPLVESVDALMAMDDELAAIAEVRRLIVTAERAESAERALLDISERLGQREREVRYWQERALEAERGESKLCDRVSELQEQLNVAMLEAAAGPIVDPLTAVLFDLPRGIEVRFFCKGGGLRARVEERDARHELTESVVFDVPVVRSAQWPSHVIAEAVKRSVRRVAKMWENAHRDVGGEG